MLNTARPHYRFSGHESFACRYAWLPKAYRALRADPLIFSDEPRAMVELGLGKNMVRSLRFWVEVAGLAEVDAERGRGLWTTAFGDSLLGEDGADRYLEDRRTLWLLHWKLSSRDEGALFAWDFLFSRWPYPELTRTEALSAFMRESKKLGHDHSQVTLGQHLDVFLHSYLGARSGKTALEDSLDGPLVELELLQLLGERKGEGGRFEPVYGFRREPKAEITAALFDYCVVDFWQRNHAGENSLTLRDIAMAPGSPGQVFKLPEDDVRARLEAHNRSYPAPYTYQPSAVQGLLFRTATAVSLEHVYAQELADA
ncbi:hypothetical protein AYR46_19985 [Sphingobium yanoikuyae]|uniref:DUF4007 family protein n=1 Tax=Sphingobium yanoikuyae TaxID=13690 RepID=UPI0007A7357D|nr:DUF4007 family protein [Sphingobium yanoikuyae]KZC76066.1 hypothetical protein AYR46_19985 [Sphingobium yanoikuyae]